MNAETMYWMVFLAVLVLSLYGWERVEIWYHNRRSTFVCPQCEEITEEYDGSICWSCFMENCQNDGVPTVDDRYEVENYGIHSVTAECYICGTTFVADPAKMKAWAESGRDYDPTDWECECCRWWEYPAADESDQEALEQYYAEKDAKQIMHNGTTHDISIIPVGTPDDVRMSIIRSAIEKGQQIPLDNEEDLPF